MILEYNWYEKTTFGYNWENVTFWQICSFSYFLGPEFAWGHGNPLPSQKLVCTALYYRRSFCTDPQRSPPRCVEELPISRRGSRALAVAQPLPSATALSKTRRASFQQGAPLGSPYYGARTALLRNARPRSRAIGYRKPKSGFQQPIRARPRPEAQAFLDKSGRGGQGLLFCRKSPGQACSTAWDGLGTWASSWVNGAGGGRRGLGADPLGSGIDASGQGRKMLGSWVG